MDMDQKECIRCFTIKPICVFEKKKRELNYRNICKTCRTTTAKITNKLRRTHIKQHGKPPSRTPCPICNQTPKTLVFDHCHETHLFRGWICRNCNAAIGKLGDNVQGLQKALEYLQQFERQALAVSALLELSTGVDTPRG